MYLRRSLEPVICCMDDATATLQAMAPKYTLQGAYSHSVLPIVLVKKTFPSLEKPREACICRTSS